MSTVNILIRRTVKHGKQGFALDVCDSGVTKYMEHAQGTSDSDTPVLTSPPFPTLAAARQAADYLASVFAHTSEPRQCRISAAPDLARQNGHIAARKRTLQPEDYISRALAQHMDKLAARAGDPRPTAKLNTISTPYDLAHLIGYARTRGDTLPADNALFRLLRLEADHARPYEYGKPDMHTPRIYWQHLPDTYEAVHLPNSVPDTAAWRHTHNTTRANREAFNVRYDDNGAVINDTLEIRVLLYRRWYKLSFKQLVWFMYTHEYAPRIHLRSGLMVWTPESVHIGATRPRHWPSPAG